MKDTELKPILMEAVEEFNKKPKLGLFKLDSANICKVYNCRFLFMLLVSMLVSSSGKLEAPLDIIEAEKLARFFRFSVGINKTLLGDFLSEGNKLSPLVLIAYCKLFNFKGKTIDQGLRVFLEGFRLPGEAILIDRILQAFADEYFLQCPIFHSSSTVYILTFSLIMLNTVYVILCFYCILGCASLGS